MTGLAAVAFVAFWGIWALAYREGKRDERKRIHREVQVIANSVPMVRSEAYCGFNLPDDVRDFYVKVQNAIWERK